MVTGRTPKKQGCPLPANLQADGRAEHAQIEADQRTPQCHAELVDLQAEVLSLLPDAFVGQDDANGPAQRPHGVHGCRNSHALLVDNRTDAVQRRASHEADDAEPPHHAPEPGLLYEQPMPQFEVVRVDRTHRVVSFSEGPDGHAYLIQFCFSKQIAQKNDQSVVIT